MEWKKEEAEIIAGFLAANWSGFSQAAEEVMTVSAGHRLAEKWGQIPDLKLPTSPLPSPPLPSPPKNPQNRKDVASCVQLDLELLFDSRNLLENEGT